jgi:hypothetical protein
MILKRLKQWQFFSIVSIQIVLGVGLMLYNMYTTPNATNFNLFGVIGALILLSSPFLLLWQLGKLWQEICSR